MNRKNHSKIFGALFVLMLLAFGCQPVSDEKTTDNSGNSGGDSKKTFTIKFDANGGTGKMNALTVTEGETVALPANAFTKEYYDFDGWIKNKTSTTADYLDKESIEPHENMTLYALWKAKKITITLYAKDGTIFKEIEATKEDTVELSDMEDSNFSHWNTKADGSGKSYSGNGKFTEDTTLYAVYLKAGEYRIIYHLDGGINNPENPLTYKEGDKIYLQEPTREGYYFVGWERKDGTIEKWAYIDGYSEHNDLEFTAVWAEQKYKIVYHSNYGTDEIFEHYFAPDEWFVYIYNPFLRDDYTLTGWYQDKDCTELYKFDGNLIIKVINKTEDIHLYAGWTENIYISNLKIKVTNLPDEVKALSFWGSPNGWLLENIQKEADKYIVDVINGGTAEFSFDKVNILVPLRCQFVPMTSKDMLMNDDTWWQTAFSGSSMFVDAENNLMYDFAANGAKNSMTLTLDVSAVYGDLHDVFSNRFFTKNYTTAFKVEYNAENSKEYKIIFHESEEGTYNNPNQTTFYAESFVVLKDATMFGYTFLGWYDNEDCSGNPITGWVAGEKIADVNLWAKWKKIRTNDVAGSGIYSYTVNISEISETYGGSPENPAFTIFLLTDEQSEAYKEGLSSQTSEDKPVYEIKAYGDIRIADTSINGVFKVYGRNAVDGVYKYYTGIAAEIKDDKLTLFVDMSKIEKTELCILDEKLMPWQYVSSDTIVDLTGYKPYVRALVDENSDPDNYYNYIGMKMTEGATFPSDELQENAPYIPTFKDLTHYAGTMTGWKHTELLSDSTFEFVSGTEDEFGFTPGNWGTKAGATITELDKEFRLIERFSSTFAENLLTTGKTYKVTLRIVDEYEAYVKVSEKK